MPRKAPNPQQSVPEIVAGASGAGDKKIRTSEPTAVILAGDILRWLIPKVGRFPKSVRYGLGSRIESTHLDILEELIRAQYETGNDRARALAQANSMLQVARHLGTPRSEYAVGHREPGSRLAVATAAHLHSVSAWIRPILGHFHAETVRTNGGLGRRTMW